jgi:hypothetical protein
MRDKRVQQVAEVAAPHLLEGERIEITAYASVGSVSIKRRVTTTAAAVLSGGMLIVNVRPRKTYLAFTSQRLLFFNEGASLGRPGKLLIIAPREYLTVSAAKKGILALKVDLAVEGQDKGLRVVFPTVARADGERIVAALRAQVTDRRADRSR